MCSAFAFFLVTLVRALSPYCGDFILLATFRRTNLRDKGLHPLCVYQFSFRFAFSVFVLVQPLYVPIFSCLLCTHIQFTSVPRC